MTCDTALILVIACITVCLKVSVGGSLLLAWLPGGKRASDKSMGTLMSVRNALGKIKTQQKSQNKIPACMWSLMLQRSLAIQGRGECGSCACSAAGCEAGIPMISSLINLKQCQSFQSHFSWPAEFHFCLQTISYWLLHSFPSTSSQMSQSSPVELETHDAGLADGKVWYSDIKALIIF